jgi:hypothetical protein
MSSASPGDCTKMASGSRFWSDLAAEKVQGRGFSEPATGADSTPIWLQGEVRGGWSVSEVREAFVTTVGVRCC